MESNKQYLVELAMINAFAEQALASPDLKRGRLKGLFKKLKKATDKDLTMTPSKLSKEEILSIVSSLERWGKKTGWDKKRNDPNNNVLIFA